MDGLTTQVLLDWLAYRRERRPRMANRHLLISYASALGHGPVSHTWILNLRGLPGTVERLRVDRQLEEAVATGADPAAPGRRLRVQRRHRHPLGHQRTGTHRRIPPGPPPEPPR
jgi:hypothetical protein